MLAGHVADRIHAEEEVRRLNAELEPRVADRTAELAATNRDLRAAMREKAVLLDEVRHRVKNNLQIVSGLLSLQARNLPPEARLPLREMQERIRAMGRAHDQLYRSTEASSFAVDRLVQDLCEDLGHLYATGAGQVTCSVDAGEPLSLPVEVAVPVALIVNEAVVNAYKHAFPDGRSGRIGISLHRRADGQRIEVRDDGVGLGEDQAKPAGQLVGMRLIRMLAAQIKATASWHTDGGTVFVLELPERRSDRATG